MLYQQTPRASKANQYEPKPSDLTAERINFLLSYDGVTGAFRWRERRGSAAAGAVAGCTIHRDYRAIRIDGRAYLAHRLVWLLVNGSWPTMVVDHINGDRSDNRIENLRDVPYWVNNQNIRTAHKDKQSGLLGTAWHARDKLWAARICVNKKQITLGHFKSEQLAHEAYLEAKRRLHEGCSI